MSLSSSAHPVPGFLIHSPLSHFAVTTPSHPALIFQGEEMSYASLHTKSNQMAHALINAGAVPGDRIGIFVHKGFTMGVAIYAILKAGCVFVPIDPFMPADRLSFIINDCQIKLLISSDALIKTLDLIKVKHPLQVIGCERLDSFPTISAVNLGSQPETDPDVVITDQYLGYIMYTSGSTGEPKGMMHTHSGSVCYANWGATHVSLTGNDRVASHAPLHFDLSIFDFFSTLRVGATVVLVPEAVTRFPASWTKLMQDEGITVVFTVPYTLITMIESGAMDQRELSSLRWVLYGGEPYPPRQLRLLMDALPKTNITNVYGPAEAPSCTCYDIPRPLPAGDEPLPIGLVSRNSEDIIINGDDEECDVMEPGELCIRSSTLTRGYWNRPDLNERAFLYRPGFGPFPHVYFRTGDKVFRDSNGLLRFLGRLGRMVKTRGHRVELDDVEAAIASMNGVLEVAAIAIADKHETAQIVAAICIDPSRVKGSPDVLEYVRGKLPPYAVPRELRVVSGLPHTSSGKVDRKQVLEQWQEKS